MALPERLLRAGDLHWTQYGALDNGPPFLERSEDGQIAFLQQALTTLRVREALTFVQLRGDRIGDMPRSDVRVALDQYIEERNRVNGAIVGDAAMGAAVRAAQVQPLVQNLAVQNPPPALQPVAPAVLNPPPALMLDNGHETLLVEIITRHTPANRRDQMRQDLLLLRSRDALPDDPAENLLRRQAQDRINLHVQGMAPAQQLEILREYIRMPRDDRALIDRWQSILDQALPRNAPQPCQAPVELPPPGMVVPAPVGIPMPQANPAQNQLPGQRQ